MPDTKPANMSEVYKYFERGTDYKMVAFRKDWAKLTDQDKADLRNGIGDGTFNY
jgi:hypothetical protein